MSSFGNDAALGGAGGTRTNWSEHPSMKTLGNLPRLPELSGMRLEPGQVIQLDRNLFSELMATPAHPARHGKFHADMYVALLVPHRIVKMALGEEKVTPQ